MTVPTLAMVDIAAQLSRVTRQSLIPYRRTKNSVGGAAALFCPPIDTHGLSINNQDSRDLIPYSLSNFGRLNPRLAKGTSFQDED